MDKGKRDWVWMEAHMPEVVRQLREYREGGEGAHVNECWRRGVVCGEPGWFFAREGPITLGTPFDRLPGSLLGEVERHAFRSGGAVLMLAPLPQGRQLQPRPTALEKRARELVDGKD